MPVNSLSTNVLCFIDPTLNKLLLTDLLQLDPCASACCACCVLVVHMSSDTNKYT